MLQKASQMMAAFILSLLGMVGLREKVERVAMGESVWINGPLFGAPAQLPTSMTADTRGQLGLSTVLAALVVVIAVSLAVIVVDRFDNSLGNPSSSSLSTAQNDVLSGFSDMTSLIGPLLLVAIAVVIIGLIRRVQ